MTEFTSEQVRAFKNYVETAAQSAGDLAFLLDNLGIKVALDWSEASLRGVEASYWEILKRGGVPEDVGGPEILEHLIGQYLGQAIIESVGGKWVQCKDKNRFFGEPCIDGFGNAAWEKVFPVTIARSLPTIEKTQPSFPGAKSRTMLSEVYRKALSVKSRATINHHRRI